MTPAEAPAPAGAAPAEVVPVRRRKYNVSEYYRMAEVGILGHEERLELIDGEILVMSPVGSPHASVVKRIAALLFSVLSGRATIGVQDPVRLDDASEPEPDISILRYDSDFYNKAHPTPADVHWLIEVMDSSAPYDRGEKLPLYARANVPEVWLVDLNGAVIETYRRPVGEAYTETQDFGRGQSLAPEAFPDAVFAVDDILG
jgi:Uma2 family endonuclease